MDSLYRGPNNITGTTVRLGNAFHVQQFYPLFAASQLRVTSHHLMRQHAGLHADGGLSVW